MGAWGSGVFENDDACDLLYEFETRASATIALERVLEQAKKQDDLTSLESSGEELLVLAALFVGDTCNGQEFPEGFTAASTLLRSIIQVDQVDSLRVHATYAVEGENSNLRECWAEVPDNAQWLPQSRKLIALLSE